jgi:hypothetical protein
MTRLPQRGKSSCVRRAANDQARRPMVPAELLAMFRRGGP